MCWCNSQWSPPPPPPIPVHCFFFFKVFTVGLSGGPIRNCGQVPGKQDPSTLKSLFASLLFTPVLSQEFLLKVFGKHWWKKKKDFERRKTTSRSWATHTPSAVVLSSFIIYRLCALIWFLQFALLVIVVVVLVVFCLWSVVIWDSEGGGGKILPPCASNRPFRTLLMACQFPLPFHFLSN